MPDSYGKRQRNTLKAKKFAAREERRALRKQQKADEAAGIVRPDPENAEAGDDQLEGTSEGQAEVEAAPGDPEVEAARGDPEARGLGQE